MLNSLSYQFTKTTLNRFYISSCQNLKLINLAVCLFYSVPNKSYLSPLVASPRISSFQAIRVGFNVLNNYSWPCLRVMTIISLLVPLMHPDEQIQPPDSQDTKFKIPNVFNNPPPKLTAPNCI